MPDETAFSPPSSLATSPSITTRISCYPTSSHSSTAMMNPSSSKIATHPAKPDADIHCSNLGTMAPCGYNTLIVPLMIAQILWSPALPCSDGCQTKTTTSIRKTSASTSSSATRHHRQGELTPCSHTKTSKWTSIGTAFAKCLHELKAFAVWDEHNFCFNVEEHHESHVDNKLREYGFYEDRMGNVNEDLIPRYISFTTCGHGHQTPNCASAAYPAKHCASPSKQPNASSITKATTSAVKGSVATKTATAPATKPSTAQTTHSATKPASQTTATEAAVSSANKPNSTAAASRISLPSTPPAKQAVPSNNTNTTSKPASARVQQKQPEQTQLATLLADCRRFPSVAESNAMPRNHLSPATSLSDVLRELNRSILRYSHVSSDNLVHCELASLVSLLNYAAAFYSYYADLMETYMRVNLENDFVNELFCVIYSARAWCIELEEYRSGGKEEGLDKEGARESRRLNIENEYSKIVPDVTDLRDGIQTVLFTFVWINYTAFRGEESAIAATLHNLIPMLQTIIVRCIRQAQAMRRALAASEAVPDAQHMMGGLDVLDLQWDLLHLSAALQNLSGCNKALFASNVYANHSSAKGFNKSTGAKTPSGWTESLVCCPYTAHLYTVAVADITFRYLRNLTALATSHVLEQICRPGDKKSSCSLGSACIGQDHRMLSVIESLAKTLTLVERTQYNWRPKMVRGGEKGKKGGKKKKICNNLAVESKELLVGKRVSKLHFAGILRKRIESFKELVTKLVTVKIGYKCKTLELTDLLEQVNKDTAKISTYAKHADNPSEPIAPVNANIETKTRTSAKSVPIAISPAATQPKSFVSSITTSTSNPLLTSTSETLPANYVSASTATGVTPDFDLKDLLTPPFTPNIKSKILNLLGQKHLKSISVDTFESCNDSDVDVCQLNTLHLPGMGDVTYPWLPTDDEGEEEIDDEMEEAGTGFGTRNGFE
ncbi:uncharacterized protein MEPE_03880 [Melanopsichium pennsylvanicum]|uniref:Uncharacterized protein n=2 Tax=Melanopsichium pennsylvanicum TaxID=63383 RepID=A0AAJ5C5W8_9BASI|nr:hypothetical protein BN887_04747 [Melanopsichium pennsylvanicum 4]SNX85171.1 uncharacterized protein MEPE_03880 [Melanopsichium pennsylvanicum]